MLLPAKLLQCIEMRLDETLNSGAFERFRVRFEQGFEFLS